MRRSGSSLAALLPLLWLAVFFAFPFMLVAKLSLSDAALAMPPYTPRIDWSLGLAGLRASFSDLDGETYTRLTKDGLYIAAYLSSLRLAGIGTAILLLIGYPIAYGISGFYTSFFRGTPLIVQLFLWYLALPQLAIGLLPEPYAAWFIWPAQVAGVVGIAFNYGAYMTEIFRSGIEAVPHGQAEAADALGMSYGQRMRRVILPQAARIVIPPTGNEFIAMIKDTALIGLLGTTLLWADPFRMAQLTGKADFRNLEALIIAAIVYWGLTAIFSFFQRKLESRMSRGYVRTVLKTS